MANELDSMQQDYIDGKPVLGPDDPGTLLLKRGLRDEKAPIPGPYSHIVEEMAKEYPLNLQRSITTAADKNTDEQLKYREVSRVTGLPQDAVEQNYSELKKRLATQSIDYASVVKETPETANFLSKPDNAAIAHDDIEGLQKVNQYARRLNPSYGADKGGGLVSDGSHAFKSGFLNLQKTLLYQSLFDGKLNPKEVGAEIEALAKRQAEYEKSLPDYVKQFREGQIVKEKEEAKAAFDAMHLKDSFSKLREGKIIEALQGFKKAGTFALEAIDVLAQYPKNPAAAFYSSAEQFPNSIPALTGGAAGSSLAIVNPALGLAAGTAGAYAGAYQTEYGDWVATALQERGFNPDSAADIERAFNDPKVFNEIRQEASAKAKYTAMPDAVLSMLAGKLLFPDGIVKSVAKGVAKEGIAKTVLKTAVKGGTEIAGQMAGEGATELSGRVAARGGEVKSSDVVDSLEEGALSFGQGAMSVATAQVRESLGKLRERYSKKTADAAIEIADEVKDAINTHHEIHKIEKLAESLNESKVGQKAPEELQELIEEAGGGSSVYFQVDDWDKHHVDKGESPIDAIEKLLGSSKEYLEAKRNGTPIEIPTSVFVTRTSAEQKYKEFLKIIRMRPDGMTLNQAGEALKNLGPLFGLVLEESNNAVTEESLMHLEQAKTAGAKMKSELINAGHTEEEASLLTDIYERSLVTFAKKGKKTPQEIVSNYDIRVARGEDGSNTGKVFFQRKAEVTPLGFYSQVEEEVHKMDFKEMPAKDLLNRINNIQGLKKEELEWMGLGEFLSRRESEKGDYEVIQTTPDGKSRVRLTTNTKETAESNKDLWEKNEPENKYSIQQNSGKVSKQEILDFIKNNGVQVQQIVHGEKSKKAKPSNSGPVEQDELSWDEPEVQEPEDSDLESDIEYYLESDNILDYFQDEYREEREEYLEEEDLLNDEGKIDLAKLPKELKTEEGKLDKDALDEIIFDRVRGRHDVQRYVEERARESYYENAPRLIVTESETGWTLEGREGDNEWWSPEVRDTFSGSAEEAQIKLIPYMVQAGVVAGDVREYTSPGQIKWHNPEDALTRSDVDTELEVEHLIKSDYERIKKKAIEDNYFDDDELNTEEGKKRLEKYIKYHAESEIGERHRDPNLKQNLVKYEIKSGLVSGSIVGNAVDGFNLTAELKLNDQKTLKVDQQLESKDPEIAKAQAIDAMTAANFFEVTEEEGVAVTPKEVQKDPAKVNKPTESAKWKSYTVEGANNYREFVLTLPDVSGSFYYKGHFPHKNPLAHIRVSDRVDSQGRKTLFVEELQSDWHQQGRERGYQSELEQERAQLTAEINAIIDKAIGTEKRKAMGSPSALEAINEESIVNKLSQEDQDRLRELGIKKSELNDKDGIPDAPFKNTDAWAALAMKRIFSIAAQEGYDAVSWAPAEVHIERWGTQSIGWKKVVHGNGEGFRISFEGAVLNDAYNSAAEAQKEAERYNSPKSYEIIPATYWLVGAVEQSGGNAGGILIEEEARRRGELLERNGERVTTKEELHKILQQTLHRDNGARAIRSMTDGIWKQMEAGQEGLKEPRKEGMQFFYDRTLPKVVEKVIKQLDKSMKPVVTSFDTGTMETVTEYKGPEVTAEELDAAAAKNGYISIREQARKVGAAVAAGMSFKDAMGRFASQALAESISGTMERTRVPKHQKALEVVLTDEAKAKIQEGQSLFQEDSDLKRGQITISPNRKIKIDLFKDKNRSTWFHEMGHFYLEMMGDLAAEPNASQEVKDDYAKILKFLGVEYREQIETKHHELWARAFETYIGSGQAPVPELQSHFNTFKVWLIAIYKKLTNLRAPINQEIRDVMNRMIVSQEEIDMATKAQGYSFDAEALGLTGDAARRFMEARERVRVAAVEQLDAKLIDDYEKTKTAFMREERESIRADVLEAIDKDPLYRALSIIQKNKLPSGAALPEGSQVIKINKAAVEKLFGKEFAKSLPRGVLHKDGLHPDVVAEMFGYRDGGAMLSDFANAEPISKVIEAEVESRLAEKHPDLLRSEKLPEEALKAIHNEERSKLLRMELELMAQSELPALKQAIKQVASKLPSNKAVKAHAEKVIGGYNKKEIKPVVFLRAQKKHAKEAGIALANGDFAAAYIAKQKELLNHELYVAAIKAQEEYDTAIAEFKKIFSKDEDVAKGRDMGLVSAARSILAAFGLGKGDKSPADHLKQLKQYDQDAYEMVENLITETITSVGHYESIPFEDFKSMRDTVLSLWSLARSQKQIEIDGKKMDLDEVRGELSTALSESVHLNKKEFTEAVSEIEKYKSAFLGMVANLTRVEHWVSMMDKHLPDGVFRKYIYQPIADAADSYRDQQIVYTKKLKDILDAHPDLGGPKIISPELKYTFRDRAELLGHMQHMGNESNLQKMLRGNGWGTINSAGILDSSKWDAFINRLIKEGVLTKADFDLLQGVWDLHEELKPMVQKAHKEMYGFFFKEIEAKAIETPWGEYRGGYVPAKADPTRSQQAERYSDKDLFEGAGVVASFPSTGKGATMSRNELYARPLQSDLRLSLGHLDWALRFAIINPRVREVARLVMFGSFGDALASHNQALINNMLLPFLQRAASQRSMSPSAFKELDPMLRYLKRTASFQIMGFNFSNQLQQLTGVIVGAIKVKRKHLRSAALYVTTNNKAATEEIYNKSKVMRKGMDMGVYDLQKEVTDLVSKPSKFEESTKFIEKLGRMLGVITQGQVNKIVWIGAYRQAIEEGASEASAVRAADSAVKLTQGSYNPEDISRLESGSPAMQMFLMFMNYFNNLANLMGTEALSTVKEMGFKNREGASRLLFLSFYGAVFPTLFGLAIKAAMKGKFDQDDDDQIADDLFYDLMFSLASVATAPIPVFGQIIQLAINKLDDKWYNDKLSPSPIFSLLEKGVGSNVGHIMDMLDSSKEVKAGNAIRDASVLLGFLTGGKVGLPIGKRLGYAVDVLEGRVEPKGPVDFTRGLLTGVDSK